MTCEGSYVNDKLKLAQPWQKDLAFEKICFNNKKRLKPTTQLSVEESHLVQVKHFCIMLDFNWL